MLLCLYRQLLGALPWLDEAVQEPLGHADVGRIMIYTHVLNEGGRGILGPLGAL